MDKTRKIAYGWQMTYLFDVDDLNQVKPDDECKMSIKTGIDVCTASFGMRVDGAGKDVKVDLVELKKGIIMSGEYPAQAYFMGEMEIEYYDLSLEFFETYAMNPDLWGKSESEVKSIVADNGGSFSSDVADYNDKAKEINDDVFKENDSILLIVIGIILALIVIIATLWYTKFHN